MLHNFAKIGNQSSDGDEYKEILKDITNELNCELNPLIIDFSFETKKIRVYLGNQLKTNSEDLIYSAPGNKPQISLNLPSLNNIMNLFSNRILLDLKKQTKNKEEFLKVYNFLEKLDTGFYKNDYLNIDLIDKEELKTELENTKLENKEDLIKALREHFKLNKKDNNNVLIYIEGEPIHLCDSFPYDEYLKLLYNNLIDNFFNEEELKKDKICYICKRKTEVTGKIDVPTKFYTTNNLYFFQNFEKENRYKSFSCCKDCLKNTLRGIGYINKNLNFKFLNLNFYVIPVNNHNELNEIKEYKAIIETCFDNKIDNFRTFRAIEKELKIQFEFLFFIKNKSEFKVYRHYPSISYSKMIQIYKLFKEIKTENKLEKDFNFSTFKDLFYSHKSFNWNKNYKFFIKTIFEFFDSIFFEYSINKRLFFDLALKNLKKEKNDKNFNLFNILNKVQTISAFVCLFKKLNLINGENMNQISTCGKKELDNFFDKNNINDIRKVFIVFGYLINTILIFQKYKNASSSFLDKVKFDGMKKSDLISLSNELFRYFQIYKKDLLLEPNLDLYIRENLHKYNNDLNPKEVTFYILLGVSLGKTINTK